MSQYSKLIAATVGYIALLSKDILGVEIGPEIVDNLVNGIIAVGSCYAVFQARNQ